jgi:deoxyuridine 5'-triphosphate nucleotidohydrolase
MADITSKNETSMPVQIAPRLSSDSKMEAKRSWNNFLCFEKMHPEAIIPKKEHDDDAGYDVFAFDAHTIQPMKQALVSTQIKMHMPPGVYGRIASRSGLAVKFGIEVGAGTIDRGYRGDIKVLLHNLSDQTYSVAKGDKIAQIILTPYLSVPVKEVPSLNDIFGNTARGAKGFGSSGLN